MPWKYRFNSQWKNTSFFHLVPKCSTLKVSYDPCHQMMKLIILMLQVNKSRSIISNDLLTIDTFISFINCGIRLCSVFDANLGNFQQMWFLKIRIRKTQKPICFVKEASHLTIQVFGCGLCEILPMDKTWRSAVTWLCNPASEPLWSHPTSPGVMEQHPAGHLNGLWPITGHQ